MTNQDMIKCPAEGCEVRLPVSDTQAQVNHMNYMLAKKDKKHEDIIQERLGWPR